jgi:HEAT repeats
MSPATTSRSQGSAVHAPNLIGPFRHFCQTEQLWQEWGQTTAVRMKSSEIEAGRKLSIKGHLATSVVLIVLGLVAQLVFSSPSVPTHTNSSTATRKQASERKSNAGSGIIAGVVINERQEPIARAQVQAFSVRTTVPQPQQGQTVPFSTRANGSASTDAEGRFRMSGLEVGDYLVAAETVPSFTSGAGRQTPIYATTFYPSTIDYQVAVRVSAMSYEAAPIQIEMVRVEGARVAGSVVSRSGRATSGMDVRLFHRFGGFGAESTVAVVNAEGRFEIPRVPPGWYRLTIAPRQPASNGERSEFATKLIEVQDKDIDGLLLSLGTGASISGRVVAEPGAGVKSAVGLRVSASPTEQYAASNVIAATVASDWSFRMTGLSGSYQFTASADRPPFVKAIRIIVDGVETASDAAIELTEASHEVVVFVVPREAPTPTVDKTLSSAALVEQFKSQKVFWRQFTIAREIVDRKDSSVLPSLAAWLSHEDRHVRGNAAFIFGGLGDPRGFQVITDILTDQSDRPRGVITGGNWTLRAQIREDRYYAAHLLGDLRDRRAVPILVPLLKDKEVNSIVPWALGQIGDKSAVGPLLDALDEDNPSMRVLSIYALETLNAKEALPRLISLLDDHRMSNFGAQVSVAEAAKAAIAKLQ